LAHRSPPHAPWPPMAPDRCEDGGAVDSVCSTESLKVWGIKAPPRVESEDIPVDPFECPICGLTFCEPQIIRGCKHTFCRLCIQRCHPRRCPACASPFTLADLDMDNDLQAKLDEMGGGEQQQDSSRAQNGHSLGAQQSASTAQQKRYVRRNTGLQRTALRNTLVKSGLALSGSDDNTLRLWDLGKNECISVLSGHFDSVLCLDVDWTLLWAISGGADKMLRIWDLGSGVSVSELRGHTDSVLCVAADCAAARALSGGTDTNLVLWNLDVNGPIAELTGHSNAVMCLTVDWASSRALSGGLDKKLFLWDLNSCRSALEMSVGADVRCVAMLWSARQGVSGGADGALTIWNLETGSSVHEMRSNAHCIRCLDVDWASQRALSGGSSRGSLAVWGFDGDHGGRVVKEFTGHNHPVHCAAVGWKASRALSGSTSGRSGGGVLRHWNLEEGSEVGELFGHYGGVKCVAARWAAVEEPPSKDDAPGSARANGLELKMVPTHSSASASSHKRQQVPGRAVSGSDDGTLRFWDLDSNECLSVLNGHQDAVLCLDVDWVTQWAISGGRDKTLRSWDLGRCEFLTELRGHDGAVLCVSADGTNNQRALSGGEDTDLVLWDLAFNARIANLTGHSSAVTCLSVNWNAQRALSGGADGGLRIWDTGTEAGQVARLRASGDAITCVSMDWVLRVAVAADAAGGLSVWNLTSFQSVLQFQDAITGVRCMSMDWASMSLMGVAENCLKVWNLDQTLKQVDVETLATLGTGTWASMTSNMCKDALSAMSVSKPGPNQKVLCIAMDWGRRRAVTGGPCGPSLGLSGGRLWHWDLDDKRYFQELSGHSGSVTCIAAEWGPPSSGETAALEQKFEFQRECTTAVLRDCSGANCTIS